jgi:ribosomal protein L11 methyltransferase
MKYPAVDVTDPGDHDLTLAIVDDFAPSAVEPREHHLRIFFPTATMRDAARAVLSAAQYRAEPVDVDDEDWARRSQENLKPITVDRITIVSSGPSRTSRRTPSTSGPAPGTAPGTEHQAPGTIVIQPSMGFGTGHHATTRLCLHALQTIDLTNRLVLDVGTGSGVLAIAAVRLGAARAVGIDYDADAIQAANENLTVNDGVDGVEFQMADLSAANLPTADIVTANLTGAVLMRSAARLVDLVRPDGTLIVSGLLEDEREDVARAFGDAAPNSDAGPNKVRPTPDTDRPTPDAVRPTPDTVRPTPDTVRPISGGVGRTLSGPPTVVWEQHEDGWVALAMKRS